MTLSKRTLLICLVLLVSVSCGGPAQRSLLSAPACDFTTQPRNVHFSAITVTDARPPEELVASKPDVRYFFTLLLWWQWRTEGNYRPEPALYSTDLSTEFRSLIERTITESHLTESTPQGNSIPVQLSVELTHLFGVSHASMLAAAGSGSAMVQKRTFAPYGFAAARVTLTTSDGKVLLRRHVIGTFDPDLGQFRGYKYEPGAVITDKLTMAAVMATGNLSSNIVRAIEPALANYRNISATSQDEQRIFFISRATPDGFFVETASIDIETGQILTTTVNRRWMEPFSAVNEWVVDPYQGGDALLSTQEYQQLINSLQSRFVVNFMTDIRTAHFFGSR